MVFVTLVSRPPSTVEFYSFGRLILQIIGDLIGGILLRCKVRGKRNRWPVQKTLQVT